MKPKVRLKITSKCNKSCSYCINKCSDYRARWTEIENISEVDWKGVRSIIISGGEPTLSDDLPIICRCLRSYTNGLTPIYLQTNGYALTKALVKDLDSLIDGIGLSIHDIVEFKHFYPRWVDISLIKPIRLYVQDVIHVKYYNYLHEALSMGNFHLRVWHEGESDPTENIFLLKETS